MSEFSRENLSRIHTNIGYDRLGFIRLVLNDKCGLSEKTLLNLSEPNLALLSALPQNLESEFQSIVTERIAKNFEGIDQPTFLILLWRNCKAVRYIEQYGDTSLLEALRDEDWIRFAPDKRLPDPFPVLKKILRAVDDPEYESDGLLLPSHPNAEKIVSTEALPPRGLAVLYLQTAYSVELAQNDERLNLTVSQAFSIPQPSSYEYLLWKYAMKTGLLYEEDILVSDSVLLSEVHDFFEIRPELPKIQQTWDWPPKRYNFSDTYYSFRDNLAEQYGIWFDEIEQLLDNYLTTDADEIGDIIESNTMACFKAMLMCDRPQLFQDLNSEVKLHIDTLVKNQDNTVQFERSVNQLSALLSDDPIFFSIFYYFLYDFQKLLNLNLKLDSRKPGRPLKQGKKAVRTILCKLIELFKKANVMSPWDAAAEFMNAMIGYEMYDLRPSEGFDTKTKGGASLRAEYRRVCKSKVDFDD